ncbi:RICIN domain-containing protein [Lentzea sp. BCCO 10_0061]|uniref:RICIN domain-containing protein n=1 Tax=Lentzea sokolovensis TaxID=3095429 RepID=A0ABU4V8I4_9PSEU|nr:RICIN domain-containing protein [Lentzea sp. BCCO 10_0061]MDX8148108.1 RICIN domain-containing protein [Lentzea sp. BCCO 10_0061]
MIAFFGVALAILGAVQPASAEPVTSLPEKADPVGALGWVFNVGLKNSNSGKCALVRGVDNQAPAVQYTCLDFADQRWNLIDDNDDRIFHLVNRNSGKCLLVQGSANDAPVVQYQCLNFADQYWTFHWYDDQNGGRYWIQNFNSGKCLLVRGGSDGTQLVQTECGSYADQLWSL